MSRALRANAFSSGGMQREGQQKPSQFDSDDLEGAALDFRLGVYREISRLSNSVLRPIVEHCDEPAEALDIARARLEQRVRIGDLRYTLIANRSQ